MKPQTILIAVIVILLSMLAISQRPVRAADLSAGYTNKMVPHSNIPITPTQSEPPDQNTGLSWGAQMLLAYAGLSVGSIILNYLWIQSVKPKRTHH